VSGLVTDSLGLDAGSDERLRVELALLEERVVLGRDQEDGRQPAKVGSAER
jgi:hypothetical protein